MVDAFLISVKRWMLRIGGARLAFVKEMLCFFRRTCKYNASIKTDCDIEKMQFTLLRDNHVIEKGMSLRNPRKGFGQQKVKALILRLSKYADMYMQQDVDFLDYPLGTIAEYIKYTEQNGTSIPEIDALFKSLCAKCGKENPSCSAGIVAVTAKDVIAASKKDFGGLLRNRHSIRYFKKVVPPKELLEQALALAQRTPSACNRQAWKTHIYFGDDSERLLRWQGGCQGFETEIKCAILVTANMKAFLWYEVHQAYIDGGLYSMNLMNALQSVGLGTIPLSLGFDCGKLKGLKQFGIAENEAPILIIGCGEMLDEFTVAISARKPIASTNTYH